VNEIHNEDAFRGSDSTTILFDNDVLNRDQMHAAAFLNACVQIVGNMVNYYDKLTEMYSDPCVFAKFKCLFLDSMVEFDLECDEYKHYLKPAYVKDLMGCKLFRKKVEIALDMYSKDHVPGDYYNLLFRFVQFPPENLA